MWRFRSDNERSRSPDTRRPDVSLVAKVRLSDTHSGTSLHETATVNDFDFRIDADCTPTSDPALGSDCELASSADAATPGLIGEGWQMVLQTYRVRLSDSGVDGTLGNADDRTFAQQGIYVP